MNFRAIPTLERMPELGKWVTTIDTAGEHRVYRLTEYGWNMRDLDGLNSPNNNLIITHWLEEESELKKVKALQSENCDWFVIPLELEDEFNKDLEDNDLIESGNFDVKYSAYRTDGDLNNIQLYAEN